MSNVFRYDVEYVAESPRADYGDIQAKMLLAEEFSSLDNISEHILRDEDNQPLIVEDA